MLLYFAFLEFDGLLAVSSRFIPPSLDGYGGLLSLAIVLRIFSHPPRCFSQQPGFFPLASAVSISEE